MRKEPKNKSKATYESYYGESKTQKYDYEYDSQYSYNYDYHKDSYYQTSGDWKYSKGQSTEYLNYKLPQKHQDNYKKGSEKTYPSTFKSSYVDYNVNEKHDMDQKAYNNPHKINKHQYSPKGNSGLQGKPNKAKNKKVNENNKTNCFNSEDNIKTPISYCKKQTKEIFSMQDKQKQSKDSNDCKLNNNLGNIKPTLSVNGEFKKYNTQEKLIEIETENFSGEMKMTSISNSNSNCKKAPKKKNKVKSKLEAEAAENSKAQKAKKIIKEINKIDELSSDIETLDDINNVNKKNKFFTIPQYQAPVYIVSPVINLNQIPPSQIIGTNLGYIPQYVQPIHQPGVILSMQNNNILGSRTVIPNQHSFYPYEINGGQTQINGYSHNLISDSNMMRYPGGQSQIFIPSYDHNLLAQGNNFGSIQQNFSNHEQLLGVQKINYSSLGYPSQKQSEIHNYEMNDNVQAKDNFSLKSYDKYSHSLQLQNYQANTQSASNGAWANQSEQLPSQSQINSLLLGPKVSIRNQFSQKEELSSNKQHKNTGLSNGFDFCGSTHNETKMLGQLSGGLDNEENDYDQLALLQSLQSLQSDDHSCNKGVKSSTIPKEDFDDFDFKSAFHLNGNSVAVTPLFENSNFRTKTHDSSPAYAKEIIDEIFSLSFDYDEPSQTGKKLKTEKQKSQE